MVGEEDLTQLPVKVRLGLSSTFRSRDVRSWGWEKGLLDHRVVGDRRNEGFA